MTDRPESWEAPRPQDEPPTQTAQPDTASEPSNAAGDAGYDNTTGSEATQVVRVDEIDAADLPAAAPAAPEPSAAEWTPPEPAAPAAAAATAEPSSAEWTPPEPAAAPTATEPPAAEWTPPEPAQPSDPDRTAIYQVQEPAAAGAVASGPVPAAPPADVAPPVDQQAGPPAPGWAPYAGAAAGGYAAGGYAAGDPNAPRPGETPAYAPMSGPTQSSYGYNDQGYGVAPQPTAVMEPPRPARVVLPKASARISTNLLAALVGLILTVGGLALLLLALPAMNLNELATKIVGTICVVIMVLPALLLAWAPLVALVPGVLFAGLSLWLLLFDDAPRQLADLINSPFDGTDSVAFRLIMFFGSPAGLGLGLALMFAGIAAIMVRRFTRRSIQDALDAEHAAAEMQPVLRTP